jgi:hypothetical protein
MLRAVLRRRKPFTASLRSLPSVRAYAAWRTLVHRVHERARGAEAHEPPRTEATQTHMRACERTQANTRARARLLDVDDCACDVTSQHVERAMSEAVLHQPDDDRIQRTRLSVAKLAPGRCDRRRRRARRRRAVEPAQGRGARDRGSQPTRAHSERRGSCRVPQHLRASTFSMRLQSARAGEEGAVRARAHASAHISVRARACVRVHVCLPSARRTYRLWSRRRRKRC